MCQVMTHHFMPLRAPIPISMGLLTVPLLAIDGHRDEFQARERTNGGFFGGQEIYLWAKRALLEDASVTQIGERERRRNLSPP